MSEANNKSKYWISFRVKPAEYEIIYSHFSKSANRKFSEYARKVLMRQPVVMRYRNQAADDFLELMLRLKTELNAIGVNYNQSVKRLHTITAHTDVLFWINQQEKLQQQLQEKTNEIYLLAGKIYKQWLSA